MSDGANLSPEEEQMLRLFRQMSPDEQQSLLDDLLVENTRVKTEIP